MVRLITFEQCWLHFVSQQAHYFNSAGDILKVSVRNQQTMSRSIIGECQLMIDQFFDGKVQEQVIPVYADQEQLVGSMMSCCSC